MMTRKTMALLAVSVIFVGFIVYKTRPVKEIGELIANVDFDKELDDRVNYELDRAEILFLAKQERVKNLKLVVYIVRTEELEFKVSDYGAIPFEQPAYSTYVITDINGAEILNTPTFTHLDIKDETKDRILKMVKAQNYD